MRSFWDVYYHMAKPNGKDRQFAVGRVVGDDLCRAVLPDLDVSFGAAAMAAKKVSALRARWTEEIDSVYRVRVDPSNGCVEVVCLGIDNVDNEAEGIYANTSTLPDWMQEKLAVLSMMKVDPPQTKIEGVGMRVDEHVFWVLKK